MSKNDGGPAFPDFRRLQMLSSIDVTRQQKETIYIESKGMSLRQWYAGMALQGLLARGQPIPQSLPIARLAFEAADAMLVEGDK